MKPSVFPLMLILAGTLALPALAQPKILHQLPSAPPYIPSPPSVPSVPPPPSWVGTWGKPTPKPSLPPLKEGPVPHAVRILSQTLTYDRKTSMADLRGDVKIFQGDTTIRTQEVLHDSKANISYINVPFVLVQKKPHEPKTTLKGNKMTYYHNEKRIFVDGDVWLLREGNPKARPASSAQKDKLKAALKHEDTFIQADQMTYWTTTKNAEFNGNVLAYQKEKRAQGDHAFLDNTKQDIVMDGNVILTQIKGDWLMKEGIVDTRKPDPERDKALKEKTVATGDHLVIDQVTNDAVLTGKIVHVDQKGRHATGQKAVYLDKAQTMTLTGDVKIQQASGDWLNAARAVFHMDTNQFEAFGSQGSQVETEFKLDEGKK